VPTPAQDRIGRGPFAALLILLSLVLSSGAAAAAGGDVRGSAARLSPGRYGVATALLPAGARNPLDDEAPRTGAGASIPPAGPDLVTRRLWARPCAGGLSGDRVELPKRACASYRARAPPAS